MHPAMATWRREVMCAGPCFGFAEANRLGAKGGGRQCRFELVWRAEGGCTIAWCCHERCVRAPGARTDRARFRDRRLVLHSTMDGSNACGCRKGRKAERCIIQDRTEAGTVAVRPVANACDAVIGLLRIRMMGGCLASTSSKGRRTRWPTHSMSTSCRARSIR